jgi:hypothetical protein
MREIAWVLLLVCACKREQPARHVALPPGPSAVLDPSPDATLPTATDPLIEARMQGGLAGGRDWVVQLWADGTVGFSGRQCHGTYRGTLPAERVQQLVDALEESGFDASTDARCVDAFQWVLRVGRHSVVRDQCASPSPMLDAAFALIRTAIGTIPCEQGVLTTR